MTLLAPFLCPCGFKTESKMEFLDHIRAKDPRCNIEHLCPICKLGKEKGEGIKCKDIIGHAARWNT